MATKITVSATVSAPIEKVWDYWTKPEHISTTFDAETTNPVEMQQGGWQAI